MSLSVALIAAALHSATAVAVAPTPVADLMKPPANATHFVVVSPAGKHGDEWRWTLPDGSIAYRESILLRGMKFEQDQVVKLGPDGMPVSVRIRGVTPSGDAAEEFDISNGTARWKSPLDQGQSPYDAPALYLPSGGTFLSNDQAVTSLLRAGQAGIPLLPSGRATLEKARDLQITGPGGPKTVSLYLIRGVNQAPSPIWLDGDKLFSTIGGLSIFPAGYEANLMTMLKAQEEAIAALQPKIRQQFVTPAATGPVLFRGVRLYDADGRRFLENQYVLVSDGKVAGVGSQSFKAPPGTRVIDGAGKTLVPGLWDAHMHISDDFTTLSELAQGITSFRNPGGHSELALSQRKRIADGELLAPEGFTSVIIDRKGPLAAQIATTVSNEAETIAAVRKIKADGLAGVKFYTSMDPKWVTAGAAEAERLGLHVHGHIPATMRPLDAVRAGYDEITHINFVIMQAMPQEIVNTSNGENRWVGPGKFGKDVDLDAEPMKSFIAELARRKTVVDPTLVVFEAMFAQDAGKIAPAYVPFVGTLPAASERQFKSGGYPLPEGYTRADFTKSFEKMVELVGRLHKAGVPIVAGTDWSGIEIIRELELYVKAGLSPADALATATIVPAQVVGADKRTGSIAVGKEADLVLVDGDVSKDIGALRRVDMVVSNGVAMDGDELRKAAGFLARPK